MKINIGIISTTHIDNNNDKMSKSALDGMADQINRTLIPQFLDHDPQKHIGVILYGKVFKLLDGEYALGVVIGLYENSLERKKFKTNQPNIFWKDYKKFLDIEHLINFNRKDQKLDNNKTMVSKNFSIADLLERYLDSTMISTNGDVYEIKKLIASVGDLKIEVYPKDHYPPHFHVVSKSRGLNARFSIKTLELISQKKGTIKSKDIKKIQSFFKMYPEKLVELNDEYKRLCN